MPTFHRSVGGLRPPPRVHQNLHDLVSSGGPSGFDRRQLHRVVADEPTPHAIRCVGVLSLSQQTGHLTTVAQCGRLGQIQLLPQPERVEVPEGEDEKRRTRHGQEHGGEHRHEQKTTTHMLALFRKALALIAASPSINEVCQYTSHCSLRTYSPAPRLECNGSAARHFQTPTQLPCGLSRPRYARPMAARNEDWVRAMTAPRFAVGRSGAGYRARGGTGPALSPR